MNADRLYIFLAALVSLFGGATVAMLSFPPLHWVGIDGFIWPAALVLWVIVVIALLVVFTPYGRRVLRGGALFFLGYLTLLLYGMVGLVILLLYSLKLASGI